MVHAKAMVVDDAFAYVGSPNMDMRSLFLNYENALCVYSPGAIGQVRAFIEDLIAQCEPGRPPERGHAVIEALARLARFAAVTAWATGADPQARIRRSLTKIAYTAGTMRSVTKVAIDSKLPICA